VAVWLFELSNGREGIPGPLESTFDYGLVPAFLMHGVRDGALNLPGMDRITLHQEAPWPLTVFTSMFMHGSWAHIIGNMWFLWIFGDNVEDMMGRAKYLVFYLLCGVAAAMSQVLTQVNSDVPMVGASGAIAGVLGAYLMLFPRARVRCLFFLFIFITTIYVPAWLLLGLWFLSQFLMPGPGVAWMAHVGGFVTGFLLVRLFVRPPPRRRDHWPALYSRV
jgi:membrane associated rhomboid family serine protease